jgi:hypothetical protein
VNKPATKTNEQQPILQYFQRKHTKSWLPRTSSSFAPKPQSQPSTNLKGLTQRKIEFSQSPHPHAGVSLIADYGWRSARDISEAFSIYQLLKSTCKLDIQVYPKTRAACLLFYLCFGI